MLFFQHVLVLFLFCSLVNPIFGDYLSFKVKIRFSLKIIQQPSAKLQNKCNLNLNMSDDTFMLPTREMVLVKRQKNAHPLRG